MKKILLTGILCCIGAAVALAQAGYKDFIFGMSAEQVIKLAPDTEPVKNFDGSIPAVYAIFMYLYNSETGSLWNSKSVDTITQIELTGEFSRYNSNKEQLTFHFFNNKLYGVDVWELPDSILAELKTKYGDKKIITLNDYDAWYIDTAVWNDGKRFILYRRWYQYGSLKPGSTEVFYGDVNVLKPPMDKAAQKIKASKSRLD